MGRQRSIAGRPRESRRWTSTAALDLKAEEREEELAEAS
jgi:hypothetical protein